MTKFKYIQWLVLLFESCDIFLFDWNYGNSEKSEEKHGIKIEQIESCFLDEKILSLGIQIEPEIKEDRYAIIAKSYDSKILFVCFTLRDGKIRPISARAANKKERLIYET